VSGAACPAVRRPARRPADAELAELGVAGTEAEKKTKKKKKKKKKNKKKKNSSKKKRKRKKKKFIKQTNKRKFLFKHKFQIIVNYDYLRLNKFIIIFFT